MRVWFNKTFSSVTSALHLIRKGDASDRYEIVVSSPNSHALAQLGADQFHDEPSGLKGDAYVNWCAEFCTRHGINVFVPGKEAALLSDARDRFLAFGTRILSCASRANLDVLHDKGLFYEQIRCSQAPAPSFVKVATIQEFDQAYKTLSPHHEALCIKPSVSVYGIGFRRIRTDRTAYALFAGGKDYQIDADSLRAMLAEQEEFPSLLLMEYLDGHEYSVDCVADHGHLKCSVARKKPIGIGGGQLIDQREDIQTACRDIVAQFGLNGYSNIQFREGRNGIRILEVNPRMSGGIGMACLAGPNLPYLGLVGFDQGYDDLNFPLIQDGLRVAEFNHATVLP